MFDPRDDENLRFSNHSNRNQLGERSVPTMNRRSARLLYAPQKVTPSPSKSAGLPEATTTPGVRTR